MKKNASDILRVLPAVIGIPCFIFMSIYCLYKKKEVEILKDNIELKEKAIGLYVERDSIMRTYIDTMQFRGN